MKNIYVLPTEKSSRVSIKEDVLVLHQQQYRLGTQNIYITSNEGVKDGDKLLILRDGLLWGKKGEVCTFIKRQPSNHGFDKAVVLGLSGHTHTAECDIEYAIDRGDVSKICLTTDIDLVEYGVQSIPNEFLEWFIENPNYDFVEVIKDVDDVDSNICVDYTYNYKIIIPSKDDLKIGDNTNFGIITDLNGKSACFGKNKLGVDVWYKRSNVIKFPNLVLDNNERMYSEDEAGELVYNVIGEYAKHYGIMIDGKMLNDLFEQFKKK